MGLEQIASFEALKKAFLSNECLVSFDLDLDMVLECDSSGFALASTLSQVGPNRQL